MHNEHSKGLEAFRDDREIRRPRIYCGKHWVAVVRYAVNACERVLKSCPNRLGVLVLSVIRRRCEEVHGLTPTDQFVRDGPAFSFTP